MSVRRVEYPHYSREQIEEHVMHALEIAAAAALEGADRAALLPQIFDKLAAKQVVLEQISPLGLSLPPGQG